VSTVLQQAFLAYNEIEEDGAIAIYTAMETHPSLERLFMYNNRYAGRKRGIAAMVEMIKKNTVLKSLGIGFNGIDERGAPLLLEALKENKAITEVKLKGNHMREVTKQAVEDLMTEKKRLNRRKVEL
jgi:Ran GTPase-activating protein (RanGAP) involved in mRNA processing and transport